MLDNIAEKDLGSELRKRALANANLVSAQLHLRAGRYKLAFKCIRKAIDGMAYMPFAFRLLKIVLNGIFNRAVHRILWTFREILKAEY